jgi:hypothetical protein
MIVKNTFYIIFTFVQLFLNAGPPFRYQNGNNSPNFAVFCNMLALSTRQRKVIMLFPITTCIADVCY